MEKLIKIGQITILLFTAAWFGACDLGFLLEQPDEQGPTDGGEVEHEQPDGNIDESDGNSLPDEQTSADDTDITSDPDASIEQPEDQEIDLCGNTIVDESELCDSDSVPCHQLDPYRFANGEAQCNASCSGFDQSHCQPHQNIQVQGIPASHQEAARITGEGVMEVLRTVQAGIKEQDIKNTLNQVFTEQGGVGLAFPHIVASGPNALVLHYSGGSRTLQDGDLLLMDIGSKSDGYCADITRTFPVNGTFSDRQREVYQLVLDAQTESAAVMKPGQHTLNQMTGWVREFFRKSPLRAKDQNGVERTMDYFFKHSLCHYVGKRVHGQDTGWSSNRPIEVGQVFTIEPGLYLPKEGLGIRIEDDYIVTQDGVANLYKNTPKTVEDLENLLSHQRQRLKVAPRDSDSQVEPASAVPNRHMEF